MKANPIPDSVRDVLSYDPETGVFRWKVAIPRGRMKPGDIAGSFDSKGYRRIVYTGIAYQCHRLAWYFVHGEQPYIIDHINHDPTDNRIANLRNVDYVLNGLNQQRSGGVYWFNNRGHRYVASVYRRKRLYTGKSILLAWHARIMAERADHPIALTYRPCEEPL